MDKLNTIPFTENLAAPVSVKEFQAEINKLFGFEPTTGRPWLRCVWMPSTALDDAGWPETFDWNEYADGGRGGWRRRYLYSAESSFLEMLDEATGLWYSKEIWDDIAPPRFMLESFIPPEQALAGWRHQGVDPDGTRWTSIRPTMGRYHGLILMPHISRLLAGGMIARHDENCCRVARKEEVDCYGYYEEPGAEHLEELRRLAWLQRKAKERRPGIQNEAEHNAARKRAREQNDAFWQKMKERGTQIYKEGFRTHRGLLSADPATQANGVYHWMSAHNKSGLKKEEKETV